MEHLIIETFAQGSPCAECLSQKKKKTFVLAERDFCVRSQSLFDRDCIQIASLLALEYIFYLEMCRERSERIFLPAGASTAPGLILVFMSCFPRLRYEVRWYVTYKRFCNTDARRTAILTVVLLHPLRHIFRLLSFACPLRYRTTSVNFIEARP